ncbi:DUF2628 domain-containing protein [Clostridium sp. SHJSY1]|uniref:DUF2628 domain-containing protein n=1 Tax=Clostridium sp. SHJSY1 TaxID=2942483 RepID=UPI0028752241|nr:DUF2628 domain-containing protein [Clostridium sp. SHJSY1]MDS0526964.1 DUF2628 domain-containing protein [Clostridium sp. SHJSY1]
MFCSKCGKELDSNNVCSNPSCPSYINNNNHTNQDLGVSNPNTVAYNVNSEQYNNQNHSNQNYNNYGNNQNYGYNQNFGNPQNLNNSQFNTNNGFRDKHGISTEELVEFVGEKKSHYYLEQWQKSQENENYISWNWPAFFTNFLWFWYRKMYGLAAIVFSVNLVLRIIATLIFRAVTRPSFYSSSYYYSSNSTNWPVYLIGLIVSILSGLFANQLYMKYATKKIKSIKSTASMGLDNATIFRRLGINGGTTIAPIIFAAVILVIIILFVLIVLVAADSYSSYGGYYY